MNILKIKLSKKKTVSCDSDSSYKNIFFKYVKRKFIILKIHKYLPVFPVKCDVCKCDYSNRDNPVTDMACNPTISQNNNENSNTSQNGTGLPFCNNTGDLNYKSFNSGTGETAFIIRIFEEV